MAYESAPKLLVTGANGKLGRRVVEHLIAAKVPNVIAASRDPSKLADLMGVETRRVDFDDAASLDAAFKGVDRVLLISTHRIDVPELRLKQHRAAVDAAKRAGVKHLLYTSMLNPDRSLIPFAPDHLGTERAIEKSGIDYTILRVSWYAENLLGSVPGSLASGKWFTATGKGKVSYVPRDDVARAAARALVTARAGAREKLDITGPAQQTIAEIVAIASKLFGKSIEVVPVSDEDLGKGLSAAGIPAAYVPLIVSTDANIRAGNFEVPTGAVKRLTGTDAQSVEAFLGANRAAVTGAGAA
jgi:NAD(P)H dehydrogenase (quinone)